MRSFIRWLLHKLRLVRASEAHDKELPEFQKRAAAARYNALNVQVQLHGRKIDRLEAHAWPRRKR